MRIIHNTMKDLVMKLSHSQKSLDMFAYKPVVSNVPTVSSCVGITFSLISATILLLYIRMTSMEYITQLPQLVPIGTVYLPLQAGKYKQKIPPVGIEISYWKKDTVSSNWTHVQVDSSNTDPFFRYHFTAKQIQEQDNLPRNQITYLGRECNFHHSIQMPIICPHEDLYSNHVLQGTYRHEIFQYFEIELTKCSGDQLKGCAHPQHINESIRYGDVTVWVHVLEEDFDPNQFHTNTKETHGVISNLQSWRFIAEPNREQLTEIVMEGRKITGEEHRVWGINHKTNINLLAYHRKETTYRYNEGEKVMNFYFQLHNRMRQEEIRYRRNSIFDLTGSWGAMAAFLVICSFGPLARLYNQWKFNSFKRKMKQSVTSYTHDLQSISKIIENHFFSDPRLLLQEDFDENGCLNLSTEELHYPSKPIGQLRRIALYEHMRKHQAATKICTWYKSCHHQNKKPGSKNKIATNQTKGKNAPYLTTKIASSISIYKQRIISPISCMSSQPPVADSDSVVEMTSLKEKDTQSTTSLTIGTLSQEATPRDFNSIKEGIVDNSIQQIKKAAHNIHLKPWTEVLEKVTQVTALTLFRDYIPSSHTSRSIRWKIHGESMSQWLGLTLSNHIHPVNFEGKVVTLPGQKPSVYGWAKIDTCDVKYDKKSSILTLRFQTFLSGTGIPDENGNPQFTY